MEKLSGTYNLKKRQEICIYENVIVFGRTQSLSGFGLCNAVYGFFQSLRF